MATKEQRQRKQFAEMLLRVQGVEYDEWLDEKHKAIIEENQELVMKGLQVIMESKASQPSNTSTETSGTNETFQTNSNA